MGRDSDLEIWTVLQSNESVSFSLVVELENINQSFHLIHKLGSPRNNKATTIFVKMTVKSRNVPRNLTFASSLDYAPFEAGHKLVV